ncbi:sialidase-4 isoform X1 [Canis aureus]
MRPVCGPPPPAVPEGPPARAVRQLGGAAGGPNAGHRGRETVWGQVSGGGLEAAEIQGSAVSCGPWHPRSQPSLVGGEPLVPGTAGRRGLPPLPPCPSAPPSLGATQLAGRSPGTPPVQAPAPHSQPLSLLRSLGWRSRSNCSCPAASSTTFLRHPSMGAPRVPERTVLFRRERSGLTYRVPALLPVPPAPALLAFAEQRLSPDDAHAHRLVQRSGTLVGGSVRWGAARVLATAALEEHRSMNPCPVHDARTATVFLFFIAVRGRTPEAAQIAAGRNAARLCCVTSRDAGRSWGAARDLTEEAVGGAEQDWATFAVGPGHGIQLPSGRLLVPAYTYRVDRRECFGRICRTSPHAFTFYSDDHGRTWHRGGLVPNLRSGECQLAVVDGGQAGSILYCNARSPLGSRVQALSADGGTSFLPGELVPALAETARGCQGSVLGFPAPLSSGPRGEGRSAGARNHPQAPRLCPGVQQPSKEGTTDPQGDLGLSRMEGCRDGPEEPGPGPGLRNPRKAQTPKLPGPPATLSQSPTWLLYSHPAGRRARLHMGIRLSRSPLDPHSWTEPWVIYEGPSGYSDLASVGRTPKGALTFACLYESGARVSYEEISFCMFSLAEVLQNVRGGPEPRPPGDKPLERCQPS